MNNLIRLLIYPIAIILLIATVISLIYHGSLTMAFAITDAVLFLIELLRGRRNADALSFVIVVLIMIIIYKVFA